MIWLFEVARWAAASVLVISGLLKLGRSEQLYRSLGELGLPAALLRQNWMKTVIAPSFSYAEITIGLGMLLVPTRVFPLLAAVFFAVFLWVVASAVFKGREASCDCFGGYGGDKVSAATIARNAGLLSIALLGLAAAPAPAVFAAQQWGPWAGILSVFLPLAIAVGLVYWRARTARKKTQNLVDSLVLRDVNGESLELREFFDPPTYLVFFSPTCSACHNLVERFRWWPHAVAEGFDLQPVFIGKPEDFERMPEYAPLLPYAWYDHGSAVATAMGRNGTPGAVRIDAQHPLGEEWKIGAYEIEQYVVRPGFFEQYEAGRETP
ncbi:hypothetical protein AUR04nite_32160 [Glutamicibacter uratoxydans]|uniref:Methylamine utilisation protein MauE domain-containing protein n=1 Tax=Glutamicibacter uratoxydans TaxID=43667 RepID=A0A4Y4DUZ5_GLUUR|nr:MauE/DoxX family redox-associated membrane protein [Glutamicibacter uratoxydans]GED07684.1 hypothetical protein AUR04nite_32160 [Glutamicibacter uratoxydans]